jgi:DNA-binding PadR family transcriptional regulator
VATPVDLTTSSYVVLCLVEQLQPATAYELKGLAHSSVFEFWSLPHTVLYTEARRLADAGLLASDQEEGGRRRRRYRLTNAGLAALDAWRSAPESGFLEVRDPGLLKLFAGADQQVLGDMQLKLHRAKLSEYEQHLDNLGDDDRTTTGLRLTLEAGIGIEREYVRFWERVANPTEG